MKLLVIIYANGKKIYEAHCFQVSVNKNNVLTLDFIDYKKHFTQGIDYDWFYVSYDE